MNSFHDERSFQEERSFRHVDGGELHEPRSFMPRLATVGGEAISGAALFPAFAEREEPPHPPERDPWGCRALNLLITIPALIVAAPILLVLCAVIYLQDRGMPVFSQERIGRGGRRFRCLKLRTMAMDSEARLAQILAADPAAREEWARDHKLRDDPRVTALGRVLRKWSLDELPQLINVLRGEMAIVGPRPIVPAEIRRYGRHFRHYCAVPPGITGLWQVSGRNDVSYRQRVVMDVAYARSKSVAVDLRIVAATVPAVLLRRGCY